MKALTQVQESAGGMLLRALLDEVQQQRQPWRNTPQVEQSQVIGRLRDKVSRAVRECVRIIAQAEFKGVVVDLDSIAIKDPTKITCTVKDDLALHALVDNRKKGCVLVFAPDIEQFEEGMESIKADADQPELPLDEPTDFPTGASTTAESAASEESPPTSTRQQEYNRLFQSIYGRPYSELTWRERQQQAVTDAHNKTMDQLRGTLGDVVFDEVKEIAPWLGDPPADENTGAAASLTSSDGVVAEPSPPPAEGSESTTAAPASDEKPPAEGPLSPDASTMSREEAERILATADGPSEDTERAIETLRSATG